MLIDWFVIQVETAAAKNKDTVNNGEQTRMSGLYRARLVPNSNQRDILYTNKSFLFI